VPGEGADDATSSTNAGLVDLAGASISLAFQTIRARAGALAPVQRSHRPTATIARMFTVAAASRHAGVVLSQPVVSTTPSAGSRRDLDEPR